MKTFTTILMAIFVAGITLAQFANAQDAAKTGKTIFEESKCTACHGIESQGVAAKKKSDKVPDLGKMHSHDKDFLAKYLKKEEVMNGKKHAVPFKGSDDDLTTMVNWLVEVSELIKE